MLLGTDDVDVLSIGNCLANERYILQREESDFAFQNAFRATKNVLSLPVKRSLAED